MLAVNGKIFLQLWYGRRACHPLLNLGAQPVEPSPIAITGDEVHSLKVKKLYVVPREPVMMNYQTITGFRKFAENAQVADFDGVEVHCANGYLLDEFLRDMANKRAGYYGGSIENRVRIMF